MPNLGGCLTDHHQTLLYVPRWPRFTNVHET